MMISSFFKIGLLIFFTTNFVCRVYAAEVAAVKGKKILISGDDVIKGKLYYVVRNGKKKGIVKINEVKGSKAMATLMKGSALKGSTLVRRPPKNKKSQTAKSSSKSKSSDSVSYNENRTSKSSSYKSSSRKFRGLGGMFAYQMNSATVKFDPPVNSQSLSGTSFGIKAFGDYEIYPTLYLRAELGTIPFIAEGDCSTCLMEINYLGGTLWARYMFGGPQQKARFWGGANGSLVFPLGTGDTQAVNVDDVGSTFTFGIGGGLDYKLSEKYYIPITAEYSLFPPNDEVNATMIQVKAGLGMRF